MSALHAEMTLRTFGPVSKCGASLFRPPVPIFLRLPRFTAGAAGFFILSQSLDRPLRYTEPSRFETMPSW
jgi:hypothetical protein